MQYLPYFNRKIANVSRCVVKYLFNLAMSLQPALAPIEDVTCLKLWLKVRIVLWEEKEKETVLRLKCLLV